MPQYIFKNTYHYHE